MRYIKKPLLKFAWFFFSVLMPAFFLALAGYNFATSHKTADNIATAVIFVAWVIVLTIDFYIARLCGKSEGYSEAVDDCEELLDKAIADINKRPAENKAKAAKKPATPKKLATPKKSKETK